MPEDLRVVAFMHAKPGQRDAVRAATLACAGPSRAEAGNLGYVVHNDSQDPDMFVVVEHWASAAARDQHLKSDHFHALEQAVDGSGRLDQHYFYVLHPLQV